MTDTSFAQQISEDFTRVSLLSVKPQIFSAFKHIRLPFGPNVSLTNAFERFARDENFTEGTGGLIICVLPPMGDYENLSKVFGSFPRSLLGYLKSTAGLSFGSSTVPEWDSGNDAPGLSFVQKYVRLQSVSKNTKVDKAVPMKCLHNNEVHSSCFAVWTGGKYRLNGAVIPVIFVFGDWSQSDLSLIKDHYLHQKRRQRLSTRPEWFYHDLNTIFSNWRLIWNEAARELNDRSVEANRGTWRDDISLRMRRLNRAMATNILLREALNIQISSIKDIIDTAPDVYNTFRGNVEDAAEVSFVLRCNQAMKSRAHDLLLAQGMLEQLQNLITMVISLEQIQQAESVGRLGVLAFIFIPLSFVAAIFGITTITIDPKWYPVWAVPTLAATIVVAVILPKFLSAWENLSKPRNRNPQEASTDNPLSEPSRGRPLLRRHPSDDSAQYYNRCDDTESRSRTVERNGPVLQMSVVLVFDPVARVLRAYPTREVNENSYVMVGLPSFHWWQDKLHIYFMKTGDAPARLDGQGVLILKRKMREHSDYDFIATIRLSRLGLNIIFRRITGSLNVLYIRLPTIVEDEFPAFPLRHRPPTGLVVEQTARWKLEPRRSTRSAFASPRTKSLPASNDELYHSSASK